MLMSCGCNLWIKSFRAFWLHRLYATALVLLHRGKVMNLFNQDQIKEICKIQKSELCHLERGEGGKVSSGFWRKSPSVWGGDLPARQV